MNTRDRYTRVIREHLGVSPDQIMDDAEFAADLGADSLDMVELSMFLEEEFDIAISDAAAERVTTVRAGLQLIEDLLESAVDARNALTTE